MALFMAYLFKNFTSIFQSLSVSLQLKKLSLSITMYYNRSIFDRLKMSAGLDNGGPMIELRPRKHP